MSCGFRTIRPPQKLIRVSGFAALLKLALFSLCFYGASGFCDESFKDFVWPYFEKGLLRYPGPAEYAEASSPTALPKNTGKRWKDIQKLYLSAVPAKTKAPKWLFQKLSTPYRMDFSSAAPPFFNDSLIFLSDSAKANFIFRPVEVSTGCISACTTVIFHLMFDGSTKKLVRILQEKESPLRKIYHIPFTESDVQKLLEIAQKLPEGLKMVSHPQALSDPNSGFPQQTWTFAESMVVSKAAYTSYRVYEAALKTSEFFFAKLTESAYYFLNQSRTDWIGEYLSLKSADEAEQLLKKSLANIADEKADASLKSFQAQLIPFAAVWLLKNHSKPQYLNQIYHLPIYQSVFRNERCLMAKALLHFESGREWIKAAGVSDAKISNPLCNESTDVLLQFLARSFDQKSDEKLKELFISSKLEPKIGEFESQDSDLLQLFVATLLKISDKATKIQLLARWNILFPKAGTASLNADPTLLSDEGYKKSLAAEELAYRLQLSRGLGYFPRQKFGQLKLKNAQTMKPVVFDPLKAQKRVLIFFASWCPHCQKLIRALYASEYAKDLRTTAQLIEVFADGEHNISEFCTKAALSTSDCSRILALDAQSKDSVRFTDRFALLSVPRIMILDESGGIAHDHLELPAREIDDPIRDLLWISQEASTSNSALKAP